MKKNNSLMLLLIIPLLVIGLVFVGCDSKCNYTCIVAFDENGNRFNYSSTSCGNGFSSCSNTCNVAKNWSNGSRYKEVKCDCN